MKRIVGLVIFAAACGGTAATGPGVRTAANAPAPAPPSDSDMQKKKQEQAEAQAKLSKGDKIEFDAAVKKWEASTKAGTIAQDCNSLAHEFLAVGAKALQAQAHFNAGTIYDSCGRSKDAENEYQASLSANSSLSPALANLGQIYYKQGNAQTAKSWFEKAIAADPTHNAAAYVNLAAIQFNQGHDSSDAAAIPNAVKNLRRALAIDNDNMAAYNLLATIYYMTAESDLSKLKLAELVCKQAKESNEKYAPIYNTLGLIKLKQKNVTAALEEFKKAVVLDPRLVEAHLNIGAIGLSARQYDKAREAFNAVLTLQPNSVDAAIGLGVAVRGEGKFDEAEKWYRKAAELDGKNCMTPFNLGLLYDDYKKEADNSNLKKAQQFYNQFISCAQGSNKDRPKIGEAQRRIKNIDDTFLAIEQAKKAEEEMKKQQEEMERQMKEQQQQQAAPPAAAATPPPAAAKPPAAAVTPPAAAKPQGGK